MAVRDDDNGDGDVININNRNRTRPILSIFLMLLQPPIGAGQHCMHTISFGRNTYVTHNLIEIKRFIRNRFLTLHEDKKHNNSNKQCTIKTQMHE